MCKLTRPHRRRHHSHRHAQARKHPKFRACALPQTYRGLKRRGRYTLRVRAIDPAGNVDPTPAKRRFKVVATRHR